MTALHAWPRTIALASSLFLTGAQALAVPEFLTVSSRIAGQATASAAGATGGGTDFYEFTNKNSWGTSNPVLTYSTPSSYALARASSEIYSGWSTISVIASQSTTASAQSYTGFNGGATAQANATASATFQVTESGLYQYSCRVRFSRSGSSVFGPTNASASLVGTSLSLGVGNSYSGSSEQSSSGTVQLYANTSYTVSVSVRTLAPSSYGPAGSQTAATVDSSCYAYLSISTPPGPGVACRGVDYNSDTALNLDDLSDFITGFYMSPPIPGGIQPDAPVYPDVNFPATPCPNAPDAPAPYATDAYRVYGYRVGFSADGSTTCPFSPDQNFPSLENLADFITSYYALFTGGGC